MNSSEMREFLLKHALMSPVHQSIAALPDSEIEPLYRRVRVLLDKLAFAKGLQEASPEAEIEDPDYSF